MNQGIAIVGMACIYPGANSPRELWENVLAQRRSFRRIPSERLRVEDYFSEERDAPDSTYCQQAAVIEGYVFDRVRFQVSGESFRATDLAHWLALDVASRALADAGFPGGEGLAVEAARVIVGNTLTGEFSRASNLRLRWPFVRRTVQSVLAPRNGEAAKLEELLEELEKAYKHPFAPVGEDTLAGGLSNTIAGRICNFFGLGAGGYTVDGACASSLLAVADACSALAVGDIDVAVAGGVDLSLDPFELVGFSKVGALASGDMRVFDQHPTGFLPGEGCGFVVLMRSEDSAKRGINPHAIIRGWGVSSDGKGGITRPEADGQLRALRRAYQRAGFGADSVSLFEGHGTGTAVGDATELTVLAQIRKESSSTAGKAAVGSVKALIGHTKAAAGIAGLIKTVMALETGMLPPTTGCVTPHELLNSAGSSLRTLSMGEPFPRNHPRRAGVSAMGFGGINCHVVLESSADEPCRRAFPQESKLIHSRQDAELFCLSAADAPTLRAQVQRIGAFAALLSHGELTDLAATLAQDDVPGEWRVAVVASSPAELQTGLAQAESTLATGSSLFDADLGVFAGQAADSPEITFLFPGQGSPVYPDGGIFSSRFPEFKSLLPDRVAPTHDAVVATDIAQPAIVRTTLAALKTLHKFGVEASSAVGHSLGELVALHWAGVMSEPALLRIAEVRGKSMAQCNWAHGAMAMIAADAETTAALLQSEPVVVAGINSPRQTIISGEISAVSRVVAAARQKQLATAMLPVSHAFHSPLMAGAEVTLREELRHHPLRLPVKSVYSTITGRELVPDDSLDELLINQLTQPVLFLSALRQAAERTRLFIEVGPGSILSGIVRSCQPSVAVATDCCGSSLRGLLAAIGASYVAGARVRLQDLFSDRFVRRFPMDWQPRFFANPCESAPVLGASSPKKTAKPQPVSSTTRPAETSDVLTELIRLVAKKCELPAESISSASRLRGDLHLSSIAVSQIIVGAARTLGIPIPPHPTDYSNVTLAEAARALTEIKSRGIPGATMSELPVGVEPWTRSFRLDLSAEPLGEHKPIQGSGTWHVFASQDHAMAAGLASELTARGSGQGVVVCLPPRPDDRCLAPLLAGSQLSRSLAVPFVVVQHGWGGSAFARTFHLESRNIPTAVIHVPLRCDNIADLVLAEAATSDFAESHYDDEGRRFKALLTPLPASPPSPQPPLSKDDVLLVTGGGKGIGAECALDVAQHSGCKVVLVGRSRPESDAVLAQNLRRFQSRGIGFHYLSLDIGDLEAVKNAVRRIEAEKGTITAVLHAAGTNQPCRLVDLDESNFRDALWSKVRGAENLFAALQPERLRFFIAFGSIIARTGLHGEAHYGLANEWLAATVEEFQARYRKCRCMVLEWSVWAGTGMGEDLGTIEALRAMGVSPISIEAGTRELRHLLASPPGDVRVVVSGRFAGNAGLIQPPTLPLRRFLEIPRVHYPGIELVVDAQLSVSSDAYLEDHVLEGERIVPAVISLEAMAQVASTLFESSEPPLFENVELAQAITAPAEGKLRVRIAGLMTSDDTVKLAIRSEATGFAIDHVRATCKKGGPARRVWADPLGELPQVSLVCDRDLYGQLLFQEGRFRCVSSYHKLVAKECIAELRRGTASTWYARHLPAGWVLGRPDIRDAAIHAIQACIPHARVLPVAIQHMRPANRELPDHCYVHAQEISEVGPVLTYNLQIVAEGEVLEEWSGLQLRVVQPMQPASWSAGTLGPYLQRKIAEFVPSASVTVVLDQSEFERAARRQRALFWTQGAGSEMLHAPNGKPELPKFDFASFSHCGDTTLLVVGEDSLACDIEEVPAGEHPWVDLLGETHYALAQLVSANTGESFDVSATRVWSAFECLKKTGVEESAPLSLMTVTEDGWTLMRSGTSIIATFPAVIAGSATLRITAILVPEHSRHPARPATAWKAQDAGFRVVGIDGPGVRK
jgi:enediyne polyketide synthase